MLTVRHKHDHDPIDLSDMDQVKKSLLKTTRSHFLKALIGMVAPIIRAGPNGK